VRSSIAGSRVARAAVLATACAVALAVVPAASAAFEPLFTATSDATSVTVSYSQAASNDGTAVLALYAPRTYKATLPTKAGAVVGTAMGTAVASDIRGATVPLDGTIRVASATTPLTTGSATTTVGDAARACSGSSAPTALWSLTLLSFNVRIPLAIAVQRVTSGPMTGGIALFICPPPADLPAGAAGRSPLGLKIVHLTMKLTNVFTVPPGTHVWHLNATPYSAGSAVPNTAGAVEAEARHTVAQELTLVARLASGSKRSDVSGRLTLAGKGVAGQLVRILAGGKQIGTAKTNASGAYDATIRIAKVPAFLSAKAIVPARYGPCEQPAFAPIPCSTSIVAGFSATSDRVRLS
jgi:hypothetical protein